MKYIQKYVILFLQLWFGAFNFFSGGNYYFHLYPQPHAADTSSAAYVSVTLSLGLFQVAKAIELVTGICLVLDVFTPLALVILFPITVNVFYLDTLISPMAHIKMSGARGLLIHLLLFAAYAKYYYPLLKIRPKKQPVWETAHEIPNFL